MTPRAGRRLWVLLALLIMPLTGCIDGTTADDRVLMCQPGAATATWQAPGARAEVPALGSYGDWHVQPSTREWSLPVPPGELTGAAAEDRIYLLRVYHRPPWIDDEDPSPAWFLIERESTQSSEHTGQVVLRGAQPADEPIQRFKDAFTNVTQAAISQDPSTIQALWDAFNRSRPPDPNGELGGHQRVVTITDHRLAQLHASTVGPLLGQDQLADRLEDQGGEREAAIHAGPWRLDHHQPAFRVTRFSGEIERQPATPDISKVIGQDPISVAFLPGGEVRIGTPAGHWGDEDGLRDAAGEAFGALGLDGTDLEGWSYSQPVDCSHLFGV